MAEKLDLTSNTIASTYTQLLHIGKTEGIEAAGTGHFVTDGNGTESVLSLDLGRVGIGTESPGRLVHIKAANSGVTSHANTNLFIEDSANNYIEIAVPNGETGGIYFSDVASTSGSIIYDHNINSMTFSTDSRYYFSGGNVGIGIALPNSELEVAALNNNPTIALTRMDDSITGGNAIGNIDFEMVDADGSTDRDVSARILTEAGETHDGANFGADLSFWTADNTNSTLTRRMQILDSGKVGIGTESPAIFLEVDSGHGDTASAEIARFSVNSTASDIPGLRIGGYRDDGTSANRHMWLQVTDEGTSNYRTLALQPLGGNVGIGTASPGGNLEVSTSDDNTTIKIGGWSTTPTKSGRLLFTKSASNTVGTLADTADDELFGEIRASGVLNDNSASKIATSIKFEQDAAEDADTEPGRITFCTSDLDDAGTPTERMRITSDGNIMINTSTTDNSKFQVELPGGHDTGYPVASFANKDATSGQSNGVGIQGGSSSSDFNLRCFGADGTTELFKIRGDGNVGIGTGAPGSTLEVRGPTGADFACAGTLTLSTADTDIDVGDVLGAIQFQAPLEGSGTDAILPGAAIWAESEGNYDNNENVTRLCFATANSETALAYAQARMTIDNGGKVGIGTVDPRVKLDITGKTVSSQGYYIGEWHIDKLLDDSAGAGSTQTCYIGNQAITTSSDMRIKENIVDTSSIGLDVVSKFRVVDFTWNDPTDQCPNNRNARGIWTGFLAQEAIEVAPYSVNAPRINGKEIDMDSKSTWMMDYGQLVPILTKAIQELSAKVTALENA